MKNPIYPCLWFDGQAKAATELYSDAFGDVKILDENPVVVTFKLHGHKFVGVNGGPEFRPNPSISFYVECSSKDKADRTWKTLLKGGSVLMELGRYPWSEWYGWLQDGFGVNWQISYSTAGNVGQKVTPALMFTNDQFGRAEEAIRFYTSVFDDSSVQGILKYTAEDQDVEGKVKHAQFRLGNHLFMAMDSSMDHKFGFDEGVSLMIECDNQEQIDYFWDRLTGDGGQESMCGWLKDKFGVSWQVYPSILPKLMADPARAERVTNAFMKMKKFDLERLVSA